MNRSYFFRILIPVMALILFASSSNAADESTIIDRDGYYVSYQNGIVYDEKTNLEWMIGPDKDTSWNEAKAWVESLSIEGGGWRMPTREELKTLYQEGAGSRNMTPLLKTTGWWVWSGETKGADSAWAFFFRFGNEPWSLRDNSGSTFRSFAVRFRK